MTTVALTDVVTRRLEILRRATGIDYAHFAGKRLAFDYEQLMASTGYSFDEVISVQLSHGVGATPLLELRQITDLVRKGSPRGQGARIFLKDEAANPSGSFKDRRASLSIDTAFRRGYKGVVAATSGNYGAAVASQAAMLGLRAIVIQEAYDSHWRGQPEILEKARKCEALGAEVIQATVGPELFMMLLKVLDETGYFNASLYTPFSVQGIETLGTEIVDQVRMATGRDPAMILATHAGGGMCTGVGRGMRRAGCASSELVGVSVDLQGLHMASDRDFNLKSFTTGHTGFSVPFTAWPDRVDVPRNAARPLRYLDRFVTVTQGSVFFATELLAQAEGLERGPAGNTSLAAALVLARSLEQDEVVVVTETEYTGAGKAPCAQLEFARAMGVDVVNGADESNVPGQTIALPLALDQLTVCDLNLHDIRESYIRSARAAVGGHLSEQDRQFVIEDARLGDGQLLDR